MSSVPSRPALSPAAGSASGPARGATLLFVDDEENILAALRRLFRPLGYRVLTARGGAEGLAALERTGADLVIADMRMPEMDGARFLAQVARRWPQTARILLTGHSDLAATIAAINEGHVYKYLGKPWEDHDLVLTVHQALELKFLEAERLRLLAQTQQQNQDLAQTNARLDREIRERDRLAAELDRELELAREIQRSLLPPDGRPEFPLAGINIAARELSGDFFDYFRSADGRICFALGDVSGKGINAALPMAKTGSLFRCLGKREPAPGRLLAQINDELCETSIRGMFVTLAAGVYDPAAGEVRFANAGHLPALLVAEDGAITEFAAAAPPLGVMPGVTFPETAFRLAAGSLYLYSDGVIEALVQEGGAAGIAALRALIARLAPEPPRARLAALGAQIRRARGRVCDDMTLLVLAGNAGMT